MDLIKVGQKLNINFPKDDKIVEITATISGIYDDRIVIDLPPYFMRYIEYLEVGEPLTIKVFSKIGTVDFNTIIISSPLEDEFSVELDYNAMKLTPTENIPMVEAVEAMNITFEERTFRVNTFEIATRYIKFYSDYSFEVGNELECDLNLPDKCGIIKFKGQISYVDPVYDNEFTVSYTMMTEEDRQTLLYYMYLYSNDVDNDN